MMNAEQLRKALHELNGERDLTIVFAGAGEAPEAAGPCRVRRAMLIPHEDDHLVKVTDGQAVFIVDAERVAWLKIG
ncbi:MAG: hypothetical protein EA379_00280 [Phycisphaerales bacterium]|jgi:hypothetical protein|nr:MAG: hypothetical protein EA379_00280 [Phycisphaerales bacterium]